MFHVKLFNDSKVIQFPNGAEARKSEDGKTITIVDAAGDPAKPGTDAVFGVEKVEHLVKK